MRSAVSPSVSMSLSSLKTVLANRQVHPWLIVLGGTAAMFGPTFWGLFHGLWATDSQGHGPIVLAISFLILIAQVKQITG